MGAELSAGRAAAWVHVLLPAVRVGRRGRLFFWELVVGPRRRRCVFPCGCYRGGFPVL